MLRIEELIVSYGEKKVLHNLSFQVQERELISIIGPNGAGKSTIIKTLCGFVLPIGGRILFQQMEITGQAPHERCRRGIAVVPEGRRVFPYLSVEKNLLLGAYLGKEKAEIVISKNHILNLFPQLRERVHQPAGTLSGGEQQMLSIGRALMAKPKLLLMDEPSTGLAPFLVEQTFRFIHQLHLEGMSILLVEQNAKKALEVADRGYVLELGRILLSGQSDDLLRNERVQIAYLGS